MENKKNRSAVKKNAFRKMRTLRMQCGGKKSGCFITMMPQFRLQNAA